MIYLFLKKTFPKYPVKDEILVKGLTRRHTGCPVRDMIFSSHITSLTGLVGYPRLSFSTNMRSLTGSIKETSFIILHSSFSTLHSSLNQVSLLRSSHPVASYGNTSLQGVSGHIILPALSKRGQTYWVNGSASAGIN